jgi:hypothetical protein
MAADPIIQFERWGSGTAAGGAPVGGDPTAPGVTFEQWGEAPSVAADIAKSGGIGLVKGGLGMAGMAGDLGSAFGRGADWVSEKLGLPQGTGAAVTGAVRNAIIPAPMRLAMEATGAHFPTTQELTRGLESVTGPLYEPKTTAGRYAQTIGEFAPAAIGGPETLGARLLRVMGPAVASETAGQLAKGTALEPAARIGGAVLGGGRGAAPRSAAAATPTVGQLKFAARAGYTHPEVAAVEIRPQAVSGLSAQIENDLVGGAGSGFRRATTPKTFGILDELDVPPGVTSVKIADLDSARMAFGRLAREVDAVGRPTMESAAASRAIQGIDRFLGNLQQPDLLAGNASRAVPILEAARQNWGAAMRAEDLGVRLTRAERQAAKAGSGSNIDNAIRQKVSAVLDVPQRSVGWTNAEKAAAERVVRGTPLGNTLRKAGKLGVSDGLSLMLHAAAAYPTGGASIPIAVAGTLARKGSEAITSAGARRLDEMLRQRSPLYRQAQNAAARQSASSPPRLSPMQRSVALAALGLPSATANPR